MKRLLFVCLGNICRSPTAEGIMRALAEERGLSDRLEIDSAGTGGWHVGEPADPRMRRAAATRGYDLTSRGRQISGDELDEYDLVVAMDRSNYEDLVALRGATGSNVKLLSEFLPDGTPRDVPDPYGGGEQGFQRVLDILEEACPRILDELLDRGTGSGPA